jgi:hypothetical protein
MRVADIAAAHQQLLARGAKFTHAPHMIHKHADGTFLYILTWPSPVFPYPCEPRHGFTSSGWRNLSALRASLIAGSLIHECIE